MCHQWCKHLSAILSVVLAAMSVLDYASDEDS